MLMKFKYEKEFREAHPETTGEKDSAFDLCNYTEWLETIVSRVELPVKPESENKKEYLIADLMENIRHSFDGADIVIKFSITAKCKHSKRTISNQ